MSNNKNILRCNSLLFSRMGKNAQIFVPICLARFGAWSIISTFTSTLAIIAIHSSFFLFFFRFWRVFFFFFLARLKVFLVYFCVDPFNGERKRTFIGNVFWKLYVFTWSFLLYSTLSFYFTLYHNYCYAMSITPNVFFLNILINA